MDISDKEIMIYLLLHNYLYFGKRKKGKKIAKHPPYPLKSCMYRSTRYCRAHRNAWPLPLLLLPLAYRPAGRLLVCCVPWTMPSLSLVTVVDRSAVPSARYAWPFQGQSSYFCTGTAVPVLCPAPLTYWRRCRCAALLTCRAMSRC
jgi:hypothetical protein